MAQLLGIHDQFAAATAATTSADGNPSLTSAAGFPSLKQRFKGMEAAIASNSTAALQLGAACGMQPSTLLQASSRLQRLDGQQQEGSEGLPASALGLPEPQVRFTP